MSENNTEWPPTFDIELSERRKAIMNCYELMERLTDEYGGHGKIKRVNENTVAVVLEYNIPTSEDN